MAKRTVVERVEEFRKNVDPRVAKITHAEIAEFIEMFGVAIKFCDAFKIITTAFYLGYMKGSRRRKAVRNEKN